MSKYTHHVYPIAEIYTRAKCTHEILNNINKMLTEYSPPRNSKSARLVRILQRQGRLK